MDPRIPDYLKPMYMTQEGKHGNLMIYGHQKTPRRNPFICLKIKN